MNPHRRQSAAADRGATILEFLVYIAVVGMVLVSATLFALEFASAQAKQAAFSEVARNGQYALARMGIEVREASGINAGSSTFGTTPGALSLSKASAGIDPTVFSVSSGALSIQQGTGAVTPLTSSKVQVTEFIVDDVGTSGRTRAVRVRLKLRFVNTSSWQQYQAESTFEDTYRVEKGDGFGP